MTERTLPAGHSATTDLYGSDSAEAPGRTPRPGLVRAVAVVILALAGAAIAVVVTGDGERATPLTTTAAGPPRARPAVPPPTPADEECPPPGAPLSSDVPAHCEAHFNAADAELRRLETSLGGLDNFETRVKDEFGERYGGRWRDTVGSGPGIAVGLVDPTPADQARLHELSQSDRVRFFPVRYSEAQLQRWGSEVSEVLARHDVKGLGGDIDAPRGRVRFLIDALPEEAAAEIARLGVPADALSIETGWRYQTTARFGCFSPTGEPTYSGCE